MTPSTNRLRACLAFAMILLIAPVFGYAAEPAATNDQLWVAANERIEQHRKADAVIKVVDAGGQSVAGADVQIEQQKHAFLFGCNIFAWGRVGDEKAEAEYRERFAEVFNFATLPFYWWTYESERGRPSHERTRQVAQWCQAQGILCKGHPLAWNYAEPRWLPEDSKEVLALQLGRIDDCVRQFRDLIEVFDVVNEATHFDRADCKKQAPKLTASWAETGQVEFVRKCFVQARRSHPAATLLINDYRVDAAYARLIEQLVDDGGKRLYDVIGIQSHQHSGVWDNRKIWEVCEQYGRFGVPLHYTETTILSGESGWEVAKRDGQWPSTPEGEAFQAREVERFYTMLYSHPAVSAITWWDFSDRAAWQRAPAGFLRQDMSAKPAYETLRRLVKEQWWTRLALRSDQAGRASFRGTLGQYQIVVRSGTRSVTVPMEIRRGADNELTVRLAD